MAASLGISSAARVWASRFFSSFITAFRVRKPARSSLRCRNIRCLGRRRVAKMRPPTSMSTVRSIPKMISCFDLPFKSRK